MDGNCKTHSQSQSRVRGWNCVPSHHLRVPLHMEARDSRLQGVSTFYQDHFQETASSRALTNLKQFASQNTPQPAAWQIPCGIPARQC